MENSIEIPAEFDQKQVVTSGSSGISDFVRSVGGGFGTELDGSTRSEVSGAMMSSKPVGGQRDPLIDRLLDAKLASGFVSAGNHVGCEVECAEGQAGLSLQRFGEFTVDVIAGVVAPILAGMNTSSPSMKAQPFLPPS